MKRSGSKTQGHTREEQNYGLGGHRRDGQVDPTDEFSADKDCAEQPKRTRHARAHGNRGPDTATKSIITMIRIIGAASRTCRP
ncbi:hypothetical protein ACFQZZ_03485 [Nocardia sp. GCM10030253]|uniref:hypothetical protein n=1 Tax=Nocardia sp. GCM10030253 TaxID=3273404 RepID=UPI003627C919